MIRPVKKLIGCKIQARDGLIGKVDDFLFDDQNWVIRYMVVDTGDWLVGRLVLLSPQSIVESGWDDNRIQVDLTRQQIEQSPPLSSDMPVSRQHESQLTSYYGWPIYWGAAVSAAEMAAAEAPEPAPSGADEHLRSCRRTAGYHIHARDGQVGHVDGFLVDDEAWAIRYIVVDTRNWLPAKKVLVAPVWIQEVSWAERKLTVDMLVESIKQGPEYDEDKPVNGKYEQWLREHFRKTG